MLWHSGKDASVLGFFSQLLLEAWPCHPHEYFSRTGWWYFFVQVEAARRPGKIPNPTEVLASGDGRGIPPTLPWQQPAEQGAVFAHRLCRCHWRRAEKPELTASVRHDWPFPPFPLSPFCGQCLSVVSCPRCSSRRQRWENRERTGWFCIAQSLQSAKPEAWEPGIPISSSTPMQLTGSSQPPVQPAADSAPRAQEADTSDHKLILSGASATEFRNFPSVNPAGLFLLSQGFAASQSLSHL